MADVGSGAANQRQGACLAHAQVHGLDAAWPAARAEHQRSRTTVRGAGEPEVVAVAQAHPARQQLPRGQFPEHMLALLIEDDHVGQVAEFGAARSGVRPGHPRDHLARGSVEQKTGPVFVSEPHPPAVRADAPHIRLAGRQKGRADPFSGGGTPDVDRLLFVVPGEKGSPFRVAENQRRVTDHPVHAEGVPKPGQLPAPAGQVGANDGAEGGLVFGGLPPGLEHEEEPLVHGAGLGLLQAQAEAQLGRAQGAALLGGQGLVPFGDGVVLGVLGDPLRRDCVAFVVASYFGLLARVEGKVGRERQAAHQGQHHRRQQPGHDRVAPRPQPGPLRFADAPRLDRLTGQEAIEVVGQGLGGGVAARRGLAQALQTDRLEVPGHARGFLTRRGRLHGTDQLQRVQHRLAAQRRLSGQALVEDDAEGVHVGRGPHLLFAAGLFGGHVLRRADDGAGARQAAVGLAQLGNAKVGDLGPAFSVQEHVGRLEVTMNDPLGVGRLHGAGQLLDQDGRLARRVRLAVQAPRQGTALDPLHRQERLAFVLAHLEHLDDAGVPHAGGEFRFDAEARSLLLAGGVARKDHLQRRGTVQGQVPGLVDDAHAAAADFGEDLVARDGHAHRGAGGRRGRDEPSRRTVRLLLRDAGRRGQVVRRGRLEQGAGHAFLFRIARQGDALVCLLPGGQLLQRLLAGGAGLHVLAQVGVEFAVELLGEQHFEHPAARTGRRHDRSPSCLRKTHCPASCSRRGRSRRARGRRAFRGEGVRSGEPVSIVPLRAVQSKEKSADPRLSAAEREPPGDEPISHQIVRGFFQTQASIRRSEGFRRGDERRERLRLWEGVAGIRVAR